MTASRLPSVGVVSIAMVLAACAAEPAATTVPTVAPSPTPAATPTAEATDRSTPTPKPTARATPQALTESTLLRVQVSGLRLRSDPSVDAAVVATLPAGTIVSAVGESTQAEGMTWYRVRWANEVGWVTRGEEGDWLALVRNGRIAFSCGVCGDDQGTATATVLPDGTDQAVLYPRAGSATWSPDGTSVVVEFMEGIADSKLVLLPADRSSVTDLGLGYDPAWSPDGARLAYLNPDRTITLIDEGRDAVGLSVLDHGALGQLAWSPDGSRLAFAGVDCPECPPGEPIMGDPPQALFVFEPPGGAVIKLTDVSFATEIAWRPDGSGLLVVEVDFETSATQLRLVELNGDVTVLAEEHAISFGHAISPDGSRLAVSSPRGIEVRGVDGSDPRVIVPATAESNPSPRDPRWSPDGRWILYNMVWVTGDAIDAWIVRADGTGATELGEFAYDAAWQPVLEPLP